MVASKVGVGTAKTLSVKYTHAWEVPCLPQAGVVFENIVSVEVITTY